MLLLIMPGPIMGSSIHKRTSTTVVLIVTVVGGNKPRLFNGSLFGASFTVGAGGTLRERQKFSAWAPPFMDRDFRETRGARSGRPLVLQSEWMDSRDNQERPESNA